MKKDRQYTLREVIKQYYSGEDIYEQYADEAEELLKQIDPEQIKEECMKKSQERSGKIWRIGKLAVNRAACIVAGVCIITVLCGFGYAVASGYIKEIKVEDKEDYSEIEIYYHDALDWDKIPDKISEIKDYYKPVWVPDGYVVASEKKDELMYLIIYEAETGDKQIAYNQYLPSTKFNYNSIKGYHETVNNGHYYGEFIETEKGDYLIVTDGIYLYSLVADSMDKESLIKMLGNS